MKTDYCAYPPQLAADVEIVQQRDGERMVFIVGSASAGRFIMLRETERRVLDLFDESRPPREVCEEFSARFSGNLALPTLLKFLAKLEQVGLLAGERSEAVAPPELQLSQAIYVRFKLFNPEGLFSRLVPRLRWIWTTGFFAASVSIMLATLLLSLTRWAEVASYGAYVLGEHYVAVLVAGWIIAVTHEFAHGMTCKAFGGRVSEVGVLLIYYFIPGLYCNVSGIHLIPQRNRRLWVIAAGIYWQLIVGTASLLAWFAFAPFTPAADLAFIVFLGSVLNIVFNANPLIKLDGYYFLSQLLRLPNLMDRSRAYWRGLIKNLMFGDRNQEAAKYQRSERAIYFAFGLLSFLYNVGLRCFIVIFIGGFLVEWIHLPGLFGAAGIAVFYARRPLGQMIESITSKASNLVSSKSEGMMAANEQTAANSDSSKNTPQPRWRRRIAPAAIAILVVIVLAMPWSASVGNYGTLIALPGREAIIRAPESATLVALRVAPGEQVAGGAILGQMGNFDLEEQIVAVQAELARANADYDRLLGALRAREEASARAGIQLEQRQREYAEIEAERRQIAERQRFEAGAATAMPVAALFTPAAGSRAEGRLPAALAALEAEVDACRAQADEATSQRNRLRQLQAQGIMPRSELDAAEARAASLAGALAAARERLAAALIEHRRKHTGATTEVNVARSDLGAERIEIARLSDEMAGARELIRTLESRRDLLARKRSQFELVTPRAGAVFGQELPRMTGQYFPKGAEICRVADTGQLLLRIQAPEREIGDVRVGYPVRLKTRTYPDRVFRGMVSTIGGESETDSYGQATYRVELTIENAEGLLRPGMTAFARIDFGRQMVGSILLHKIKQALRPELWML